MAETPEDAVALSDADIDELVNKASGSDSSVATDTVDDSEGTASNSVEAQSDESKPTGETEEGAEEEPTGPAAETPVETGAVAPPPVGTPQSERAFTFKGAGQYHTLPGALEQPDGSVRIAREGAAQLRETLASAVGIQQNWKTERRQLERDLRQAKAVRSDKDIEAEQITGLFTNLRDMTPEQRWQWAEGFSEQAPKLELQIEKQKLERDRQSLERERKGPELSDDEVKEQVTETLQSELRTTFQRLMASPEAKNLSREDQVALWNKWAKKPDRLVIRADRDMPELGIKKGDRYFDDQDVVDDFVDRVSVRSQASKTLSAQDRNAGLNADQHRGNAIPPTVASRTPLSSGKPKPKKLTGKAFQNAFMRGELDDRDG